MKHFCVVLFEKQWLDFVKEVEITRAFVLALLGLDRSTKHTDVTYLFYTGVWSIC